jgi:acyl-CoA synthetase (AMP-forming)/AMP-acid ligase II
VVDPNGNTLPERHVGEIQLQGASLFQEYWQQPALTAASFQDGWFKTGDLGYLADGQIYITGRKKEMINVGGKNIYPQDIDTALKDLAGIRPGQVVTFGVDVEESSTEGIVVVAELQRPYPDDLAELDRTIRSIVKQTTGVVLHNLELIKGRFVIKTTSGKIARNANREKYLKEFC